MGSVNVEREEIREAVANMLRVNMGLRDGEEVLVVSDYPDEGQWTSYTLRELSELAGRALLARAVADVAEEEFANKVSFKVYPATGQSGKEPPRRTADAMKKHDVVLAITSFSLSHTNGREEATDSGCRLASMPGFTAEMLEPDGPMAADYRSIAEREDRLVDFLGEREEIRILDGFGGEFELSTRGRRWRLDTGLYTEEGKWGNLPAGEVYIAPLEGTAHGSFTVQEGWHPHLEEDMTLRFEDGVADDIAGGGEVGDDLREKLGLDREEVDEGHLARRNVAELGIGANPNARRPDNVLEAEKILGTVHVAIGNNVHFGGMVEADLHQDFVLPRPSVYADDDTLMDDGDLVV